MIVSCIEKLRLAISQNKGSPTSVPKVPGAFFARPVPKPKPKKCAGCEISNLKPGCTKLAKMIKPFF